MACKLLILGLSLGVLCASQDAKASPSTNNGDVASLVNLFIGTTNGGHVFPGA
jgi:hypothetical protein